MPNIKTSRPRGERLPIPRYHPSSRPGPTPFGPVTAVDRRDLLGNRNGPSGPVLPVLFGRHLPGDIRRHPPPASTKPGSLWAGYRRLLVPCIGSHAIHAPIIEAGGSAVNYRTRRFPVPPEERPGIPEVVRGSGLPRRPVCAGRYDRRLISPDPWEGRKNPPAGPEARRWPSRPPAEP